MEAIHTDADPVGVKLSVAVVVPTACTLMAEGIVQVMALRENE